MLSKTFYIGKNVPKSAGFKKMHHLPNISMKTLKNDNLFFSWNPSISPFSIKLIRDPWNVSVNQLYIYYPSKSYSYISLHAVHILNKLETIVFDIWLMTTYEGICTHIYMRHLLNYIRIWTFNDKSCIINLWKLFPTVCRCSLCLGAIFIIVQLFIHCK